MPRTPDALLPLKADTLEILLAVDTRPRHGYGIIKEVARRTQGGLRLQTGALYRALKHLLDEGLIDECGAPTDAHSEDERRRYYCLTKLGSAVLDAELARLQTLVRNALAQRRAAAKPSLA